MVSFCVTVLTVDDLLQRFWKIEDCDFQPPPLSADDQAVVEHFHSFYDRDEAGRFIVPLPKKSNVEALGESRSLAVRRFLWLEMSLHSKNKFEEFADTMQEYFDMGHA